jgi:hypothetical protein
MITVMHDHDNGTAVERCCFCRTVTHFWFVPNDVACCESCAKRADAADVPDKHAWCRRERIAGCATYGLGTSIAL